MAEQELDLKKARALIEQNMRKLAGTEGRALEIFAQLMRLPEFMQWMEENIIIRDEVDHKAKVITTYVIYKGGGEKDWWCPQCTKGFTSIDIRETIEGKFCSECDAAVIAAQPKLAVDEPSYSVQKCFSGRMRPTRLQSRQWEKKV